MNILIVYAHHEPGSFTSSLKNLAVEVLEEQGHTVVVSDLYGQGFSAVAQKWDFVTTSGNHFNYMLEQKHAANLGMSFSPDILGEIQKIQTSELVLFIAPMWWMSVPAILKGWFDRVLAMGFAWDDGKIFENGKLRGKQAIMITTAGFPAEYFSPAGRYKADPNQILYPINYGTLATCGFNVHEPFLALNILGSTQESRDKIIKDYEYRIRNLTASPQWLIFYG
ncbi:MAG TPA: NAD(P)H-dependent oxidoreductase [Candidatus Saccharimonadales bacterium]|nr:NAD(P)H-dependent oxidoreductase [Candidatus Saccharimonadales bacterium]